MNLEIQQQKQKQKQHQRQKQRQQEILELSGLDYPGETMIQTRIKAFYTNLEEEKNTLKIVKLKFVNFENPRYPWGLTLSLKQISEYIDLDRLEKLLLEIVNLEDLGLARFYT